MSNTYTWKRTDPRFEVNKRANIVILRPLLGAAEGFVDTKECWSIWTDFEDHRFISADDKWDEDWYWIFAPR